MKRRLWNAGLLSRAPLSSVCVILPINLLFLLASLRYGFFFTTLPRSPSSRSHNFTVDVESLFWKHCMIYFIKLNHQCCGKCHLTTRLWRPSMGANPIQKSNMHEMVHVSKMKHHCTSNLSRERKNVVERAEDGSHECTCQSRAL
jgi:hypothetical protein